MEELILGLTKEGDTILDPFMGVGSTGVACVRNNRNFYGYDIIKDYVAIAKIRIKEVLP
jgi:DNA modification methylase